VPGYTGSTIILTYVSQISNHLMQQKISEPHIRWR